MAKKQRTQDEQIARLRGYNVTAGFLHLIQAVGLGYVLTLLDFQVVFPTTIDYPTGPPGFDLPTDRVVLFDVNIGAGVVAFIISFFRYNTFHSF